MNSAATSPPQAPALRGGPMDQQIPVVVLLLSGFGVVAVYSAITFLAQTRVGGGAEPFLLKHLMRLALAFAAMLAFSRIDYHRLVRHARWALLASIGLLILVHLLGMAVGGASRWLRLGPITFQPSDFARVSLMLYVAGLLVKKQAYIEQFSRAFAPLLFWTGLTVLCIGIENLSTAALVLTATCIMLFVGRVRVLHLAAVGAVGAVLVYAFLLTSPGRAARVESYVGMKLFPNTEAAHVLSAQGEGYQAQQAQIAIALGGITGVGPGKSVQRDFLPAPYNDFIYAIIAEEYGLLGSMSLLGCLALLMARGFLRIARRAPDLLGFFLAVGYTTMIVLYGFIHAGVSCGLLPVTGLPMPFVSYGGTSLVATGVVVGILLNISRQGRRSDDLPAAAEGAL